MKKLISLALAFLLAFSCFALAGSAFWGGAMPEFNPGTYNATDYSTKFVESKCVYKGSDGSTSTSTYSYDDAGNLVKSTYTSGEAGSTTTYAYDSNGNVTKRVFKNASGAYSETETFTYTSKGLLSKQTYKTTENGSTNTGTFTHTYNSKGLLTKRAYSVSGGDYTYSYNYSYDADGNVSKIVLKSSDSPSRTTTYTYNSKNLLTKSVTKYGDETTTTKYTYDSNGNRTKTVCTSTNEYEAYTNTCSYDANGNVVTDKTVTGTGETYTTKRGYDSKGRMIKETYKSAGDYSYTWKLYYDSNGNISKETFDSGDGVSTTTYTYKKLSTPVVRVRQVTLSYASTTYDGKAKKPVVHVRGASEGADYRLEYSNNVKPGKAQAKIIFNSPEMGVITINFDIKPAKPTGLKVTSKAKTSLTLTWGKVTGATKYIVYKYTTASDKYTKLTTVTSNKATIKDLKAGTSYKLCVVAVASGGVRSAYSGKLAVKTAS